MCRLLIYSGQPACLSDYVLGGEHSFVSQSMHAVKSVAHVNGDGFGIGWYSGHAKPARYRDVLPAWADENLQSICQHIQSHLLFAHIRASTATATSRTNCHPFTFGPWMFMHNGQVGDYLKVRRPIEQLIGDEAYTARSGSTDSEALFLALFSHGLAQSPLTATSKLLGKVEGIMRTAGIEQPLRYTAALTNGESVYAVRYASDREPPTLFYRQEGNNTLISSEPIHHHTGWHALPVNHSLTVRAGQLDIAPFSAQA